MAFAAEVMLLRAYANGKVVLEFHPEDWNGFLAIVRHIGHAGQRFEITARLLD